MGKCVRMLECPGSQWESKQSILGEALTDSSIVSIICFVNCPRISELISGFELEEQQQQQQQMVCPMAHSTLLSASTVVGNQPAIPSCFCRLLLLPRPSPPAIAVSSVNRFQTTKPTSWCLRESEGRGSFCRPPARCQFASGDDEPEVAGITLQEREGGTSLSFFFPMCLFVCCLLGAILEAEKEVGVMFCVLQLSVGVIDWHQRLG